MKTILVIEDNAPMRADIVTILELEGFNVHEAGNGVDGIEIARREHPDLILCDVMMPKLNGYGVLQAMRTERETSTIPFIFLTAKGTMNDLRDGMNLGADDYLTKPVSVPHLVAAVKVRLKRAALHRANREPNFSSHLPLIALGISDREAEVLLWVAQGKGNAEVASILNMNIATVKKHLEHVYEKLGIENRSSATLRALEVLGNLA